MLYEHYSEVPWDKERWPNFSPDEPNLFCPCCGEFYFDPIGLDMLQNVRKLVGRAIRINSGHRCPIHNVIVGGAPLSEHKKIAYDISIRGQDPGQILIACVKSGFTTFGFYGTFLHTDRRPNRRWITEGGKKTWSGLLKSLAL